MEDGVRVKLMPTCISETYLLEIEVRTRPHREFINNSGELAEQIHRSRNTVQSQLNQLVAPANIASMMKRWHRTSHEVRSRFIVIGSRDRVNYDVETVFYSSP